jgi:WD40 repeat protein
MSAAAAPVVEPYVGLRPYEEDDADFFFGRERDQEVIRTNLFGARLSILYGPSGAGKSSLLRAGIASHLRQAGDGTRAAVFYFSRWSDTFFLPRFKQLCRRSIEEASVRPIQASPSLPLDEFLKQASDELHGQVLIILDQFEEYLLYHPANDAGAAFDVELARAVNRPDVRATFLIGIREDALAALDARFRLRFANLLANTLPPLRSLDSNSARRAIQGPLDVFRTRYPEVTAPDQIEPALVEDILEQVRPGRGLLGEGAGMGSLKTEAVEDQIETVLLQLVMTRLWEVEYHRGSRLIRRTTFQELGETSRIVRDHLEAVLLRLTPAGRDICAAIFPHLVTPGGRKISQEPGDLAYFANEGRGEPFPPEDVQEVLVALSIDPRARLLRRLDRPERYEVYHDRLADAILGWCRVYETERAKAEAARRAAEEAAEMVRRQEEIYRATREAEARVREETHQRELIAERRRRNWMLVAAAAIVGLLLLAVVYTSQLAHSRALAAEAAARSADREINLRQQAESLKTQAEMLQKRAQISAGLAETAAKTAQEERAKAVRLAAVARQGQEGARLLFYKADQERRNAEAAREREKIALQQAQEERRKAEAAAKEAMSQKERAEKLQAVADAAARLAQAGELAELVQSSLDRSPEIALRCAPVAVSHTLQDGNVTEAALQVLAAALSRSHLIRGLSNPSPPPEQIAFDATGRYFAAISALPPGVPSSDAPSPREAIVWRMTDGRLWDLKVPPLRADEDDPAPDTRPPPFRLRRLAFSGTARGRGSPRLTATFSSTAGQVRLLEWADFQPEPKSTSVVVPVDETSALAFSTRGDRLALVDKKDESLTLYDFSSQRRLAIIWKRKLTEVLRIPVFSPDDKLLAGQAGAHSVQIWDIGTGSLQKTVTLPSGVIRSIAFGADSASLMVLISTALHEIDLRAPEAKPVRIGSATTRYARQGHYVVAGISNRVTITSETDKFSFPPGRGTLRALAFAPAGAGLVTATAQDVRLWSLDRKPGVAELTQKVQSLLTDVEKTKAKVISADASLLNTYPVPPASYDTCRAELAPQRAP